MPGDDGVLDDKIVEEEEKSSPVILDNVENFMLNIEEEVKNQEEDKGDLDNDYYNEVDDVVDIITVKEVGDKHLVQKQRELPEELPEADRAKQQDFTTENMKNKNINISVNNPTRNNEETKSVLDVDYEAETVKNVTKVMKIVDQKTVDGKKPLQEENDTNIKGERMKLPRIKIQDARIKILSQVESETNNDDIVFIIYLSKSDSQEIESNTEIEDFMF